MTGSLAPSKSSQERRKTVKDPILGNLHESSFARCRAHSGRMLTQHIDVAYRHFADEL